MPGKNSKFTKFDVEMVGGVRTTFVLNDAHFERFIHEKLKLFCLHSIITTTNLSLLTVLESWQHRPSACRQESSQCRRTHALHSFLRARNTRLGHKTTPKTPGGFASMNGIYLLPMQISIRVRQDACTYGTKIIIDVSSFMYCMRVHSRASSTIF